MVYNRSFALINYHEVYARPLLFAAACAERLPNILQLRAFWTGSGGPRELGVLCVTAPPRYSLVVDACFARICKRAAKQKEPKAYEQLQENLIKCIVFFLNMQVPGLEREARTEIVLGAFFTSFLKDYTHSNTIDIIQLLKNQYTPSEFRRLLIAMLYQIYFKDFFHPLYNTERGKDKFVLFSRFLTDLVFDLRLDPAIFWQFLSSLDNPRYLGTILLEMRAQAVDYREGSRFYFDKFEEKLRQKGHLPEFQWLLSLIRSFRRHSTNTDQEWFLFIQSAFTQPSKVTFAKGSAIIEGQLDKQAAKLCRLLRTAPLIASLAVKLDDDPDGQWTTLSERYQKRAFTESELRSFLSLFGLRGYEYCGWHNLADEIEKDLKEQKFAQLLPLLQQLYDLLEAFIDKPSRFNDALDFVTYALPTCNKDLSQLAWLPSVVKAFGTLRATLNQPVTPHLFHGGHDEIERIIQDYLGVQRDLSRYPIFVFDQSDPVLFAKNRQFIEMLTRCHRVTIVHLSKREILDVAAKLKVERMIDTTGRGQFGYGGARNAVYLLAPVLREVLRYGRIADAPVDFLRHLFKKHVLQTGSVVHMGDDDAELPETLFFTDLLFANEHRGEYFKRPNMFYGRATNSVAAPVSLQRVFEAPREAYQTTLWRSNFGFAGMMSSISSPRFCLNLPFGCEEGQDVLFGKREYTFGLNHPTVHLAGSRYPTKELPLHPFVGLKEHLEKFIPYSAQIGLVGTFVVPDDIKESPLPWKQCNPGSFSSLGEVFDFCALPTTQKEMESRFWTILRSLVASKSVPPRIKIILALRDQNVDQICAKALEEHPYAHAEIEKLGVLFRQFKKDAQLFCDFAILLNKNAEKSGVNYLELIEKAKEELEKENGIALVNYPITEALYMIARSIGGGEFSQLTREAIS